ncbi:hypothetical protein ABIE45_002789 [Methylobacterium sp. OAE515]|uniref:hypothetical protein n=1 Tax=Methylobacterium sp. OAE515 TaxID=2817895 RepID=UPI00178A495D
MIKRLVLKWLFGTQPAAPPSIVHRGERELCAGPDLGAPAGLVPKLSYDEALACFGVRQGGRL